MQQLTLQFIRLVRDGLALRVILLVILRRTGRNGFALRLECGARVVGQLV